MDWKYFLKSIPFIRSLVSFVEQKLLILILLNDNLKYISLLIFIHLIALFDLKD